MRVGVVDCGTNTVRLLIADGEPGGAVLTDVVRTLRFVRLGQGVDATHRFHPDALSRTFAALDDYAGLISRHGPLDGLRFLATSAARDATNRDEFFAGVRRRLGVEPEVVTGEEEARLSFLGAIAGGPVPAGALLVVDIGGGSTELVLGEADGEVKVEQSFDVGSVRLRERFLHDDPPTPSQVADARRHVASLIDNGRVPLGAGAFAGVGGERDRAATFIGVAGTNTSLSAMRQGLSVYDANRVHNSTLTPEDIAELADELLRTPVTDVRDRYPFLEPMRAEVICAGALIAAEVARRVGRPMLVRETDILDGAALALVAQR